MEEIDGRRVMLPCVVGDENDDELRYFQYARAKHGNQIKLVATYKEKGICQLVCEFISLSIHVTLK